MGKMMTKYNRLYHWYSISGLQNIELDNLLTSKFILQWILYIFHYVSNILTIITELNFAYYLNYYIMKITYNSMRGYCMSVDIYTCRWYTCSNGESM